MYLERFHHPFHIDYHVLPIKGLGGLSLNMLLRRIASSMIGLYVPIFIFQLFHGTKVVFLYFFVVYFVAASVSVFTAKIMRWLGVDIALMFGSIFRIIYILLLGVVQFSPHLIFVSAFFYGLTMSFDWLPFHYSLVAISGSGSKKNWGSASSKMEIFARIAGALGPVVGGAIIYLFSYQMLFAFASVILVFAAVSPFLDEFNNKNMYLDLKDVFSRFKNPDIKKHFFAHGLSVFEINAYGVVWPLILLSIFGSTLSLGVFQSVVLAISLLVFYLFGKRIDHGNVKSWNYGYLLASSHWWVRFFMATPVGILFSELIFAFSQAMVWLPFTAIIYAESSQDHRLEFLLVRNIVRYISGATILLFLWLISKLVNDPKTMLLIFGMLMLLTASFKTLFKKEITLLNK